MRATRRISRRADGERHSHSWATLFGQSLQRHYGKNQPIYTIGARAAELYMIISGRVKISLLSRQGREKILYLLGEGDVFGELSLIGEERAEMAITCEPTTVGVIAIDRVRTLIWRDGQWAHSFLQLLCHRIRLLEEEIESQAFHSVEQRLRVVILKLAEKFGIRRNGRIYIARVTHETLAQLLGVYRETVSHWMPSLARERWVAYRRGQISIREDLLWSEGRSKLSGMTRYHLRPSLEMVRWTGATIRARCSSHAEGSSTRHRPITEDDHRGLVAPCPTRGGRDE